VAASTVVVDGVRISGAQIRGIFNHNSAVGRLIVRNSILESNGVVGISVGGVSGNGVVLDNVHSLGQTYGLAVAINNTVAVTESVFEANGTGVEGDNGTQISIEHSRISHNTTGLESNGSTRLSNTDVSFNNTGVIGSAGSFGNNRFSGNGSDGAPLVPLGSASTDLAQK
jgi:hypothetical protein